MDTLFGGDDALRAVLGVDWEQNATRLWNIPLHPMGELNTINYMAGAPDTPENTRHRIHGAFMQLPLIPLVTYLFVRGFIISVRMVHRRPAMLAGWCCLVQTFAGVVYGLVGFLFFMPSGITCRHYVWYIGSSVTLSTLCVGITLLQRAYLVHRRSKWLLTAGVLLLIPQPLTVYFVWTSPVIMTPQIGCLSYYPSYFPWIKLGIDLPINVLFSTAFIIVVYRQYRLLGSAAWAHLVRNGIQTMCAIVLSNIICVLGTSLSVFGQLSQMLFVLDWIITSILLVRHCVAMNAIPSRTAAPRDKAKPAEFAPINAATANAASWSMPVEQSMRASMEHTVTREQ
ncbi:hypothetical protein THASP1DRAFT_23671 [Thamnocephalis sphaerospora]|uniref:Uncharacterized protein n=1 Tax=Thamnocephalis sphaerospora TaxID=78915 RepID=A0A4P9XQI7_9FUNG|nr:hypothetical protein THASP1DRAFT_23671 [Thamnocephalis sphaerospora]|eukprot:RKP08313.1 hypothetical protein THASP1DRAFT_23671 [Thamnocephalis sphaerospora]